MKTIKLPVLFSQWDSRWSKKTLGNNTPESIFDIYNFGCLVTCLAMICRYLGYEENPDTINDKLKKSNGFGKYDGLYIWGSFEKLFKSVKKETKINTPNPLTDDQLSTIRDFLDKGNPVMVQLDYDPKTLKNDMHYVLLTGYNPSDENDFLIADPLGGKEISLKKYLGWYRPSVRNTVHQYILFDCDVPETAKMKDMIIDFDDGENKRHSVGWYVYEWFNEKVKRLKEIEDYENKLEVKDGLIKEAVGNVKNMAKEVSRKEAEIKKLHQKNAYQKAEIERLRAENASLWEVRDLVNLLIEKLKILLTFKK